MSARAQADLWTLSDSTESVPPSISRPAMLVDDSDREFRRLIHRMIVSEGRLVDIRKAIGHRVGVTGPQYTLLMTILHLQGKQGISIGALASHMEFTGAHITGEIRKLLTKGFVRKVNNPRDKRGVLVRLSPEGRRRLTRAFEFIRNVNDILFDHIGVKEFRVLSRFHEKFMSNTARALDWTGRSSEMLSHLKAG